MTVKRIVNNCLLEIRPAAGGEEAKIWAKDLLRMYLKFSTSQGWQTKRSASLSLEIKGDGAFEKLKFETGVHRVQRVPATEKHGRIHTSTATVAVLPKLSDDQIKINPQDLDWQFFRASTQGGQNVQKVSTAVRLTHRPSRIMVTCEQERSQEQNRKLALELLKARLWQEKEAQKEETVAQYRSGIGRGMRAEKIRTYNFSQNRVTDHRLKKSWHNLERILDGNLKKIIKTLRQRL